MKIKAQSTIEKAVLTSIIAIIAILVTSLYINFGTHAMQSFNIKYITAVLMNNVYGSNSIIYIESSNKLNLSNNDVGQLKLKITYQNKTSKIFNEFYKINDIYSSINGKFYYKLLSTNFSIGQVYTVTPAKISLISFISGEKSIDFNYQNQSITIYPTNALPAQLFLLNMSVFPPNSGETSPTTSYYYNGSYVPIIANPNKGYSFETWIGEGKGNYTGNSQSNLIKITSNLTEIAKMEKSVNVTFSSNYNNAPFYICGSSACSNKQSYYTNKTLSFTNDTYVYYSFANSYNTSSNYYFLSSVSGCYTRGNNQTIHINEGDNGCIIKANYTRIIYYYITFETNQQLPQGAKFVSINGNNYTYTGQPIKIKMENASTISFAFIQNATPGEQYFTFSSMSVCGSKTSSNNDSFTVTQNCTVEANYNVYPFILYAISLQNYQPIPTTAPFQQNITLSESSLNGIEYNGNFANFKFTSSPGGSVLPAWIENNNSGNINVWVNLPNGINAYSTDEIYLEIYNNNNTNQLSSSGTSGIGEAPQLPNTYAEYDDGKSVFNNYYNFAGTALNTIKWNNYGSDQSSGSLTDISVDNKLILTGGGTGGISHQTWIADTNVQWTSNMVLDVYEDSPSTLTTFRWGMTNTVPGTYFGGNPAFGIQVYEDGNWYTDAYSSSTNQNEIGTYPTNQYNIYSITATESKIVYYLNSYNYAPNAGQTITTQIPSFSSSIFLALTNEYTNPIYVQWIRTRAYPPNGVMPTVKIT